MDKCDMTRGLGTKVQCIEENFDKRVMVIIKKVDWERCQVPTIINANNVYHFFNGRQTKVNSDL